MLDTRYHFEDGTNYLTSSLGQGMSFSRNRSGLGGQGVGLNPGSIKMETGGGSI